MTSPAGAAPVPELQAKIQGDLNTARKAQDKNGVLLLGTILADIKNRRIEEKRELSDIEVGEVLRRGIKKRRESIEMYDKAARADLADRERAEVKALETYLPANVSDDEIRAAIRKVIAEGATNMGGVMGKVTPMFKGRSEGSTISRIAKEELSSPP
ncbi:MAG: GatB/YqeY domain-containing protein [Gemmatimonadaceae bacterium]